MKICIDDIDIYLKSYLSMISNTANLVCIRNRFVIFCFLLSSALQGLPMEPPTRWRTWWRATTWFFNADSPQPWPTPAPHYTGSGGDLCDSHPSVQCACLNLVRRQEHQRPTWQRRNRREAFLHRIHVSNTNRAWLFICDFVILYLCICTCICVFVFVFVLSWL